MDRALRGAHGHLVDEHRPNGCGRLQPRSGVDDVAGDDSLSALGACTECDDGLARGDGGAHGDLEPVGAELLDRVQNSEPGAHCTFGVVLVRHGSAEDRHHSVSDELLHGSAEPLDVGLHALVVRAQRRADVLRIGAVGAAREADEIDEEHRNDLPLLPCGSRVDERLCARKAEPRTLRVLLTARGANPHQTPRPYSRLERSSSTGISGNDSSFALPRAPSATETLAIVMSSGASTMFTKSYSPRAAHW